MTAVPWWAVVSSNCAPVALIGGWAWSASLQPPGYDQMTASISALAANGALDPWLMSGALYLLGVCHLITALGLRPAATPGRVLLACGGVASFVVALSPEPPGGGTSLRHMISSGTGFALLALFPILSTVRGRDTAWPLRPTVGRTVTVLMALGAVWFLIELHGHGVAGLAERILTGAQTLWPTVVVVACFAGHYGFVTERAAVGAAAADCDSGEGGQR